MSRDGKQSKLPKLASRVSILLLAASPFVCMAATPVQIVDGNARFTVLSPTLVRMEFAADGKFDDVVSFNSGGRGKFTASATPPVSTVENGWRVIDTGAMTVRYKEGSGKFTPQNTEIDLIVGSVTQKYNPEWATGDIADSGNLGGFYRGLDNVKGPVALHDGVLTTNGWYLLNDSTTAIADGSGDYMPRAAHGGTYQDGYLFGYKTDYLQALHDLHTLTGVTPLPPKNIFGVMYSRWFNYTEDIYKNDLLANFDKYQVPLDVLITDTDFKAPNKWDGWEWSKSGFPDPVEFEGWVHSRGMLSALNIHPAINDGDPKFAGAQATADNTLTPASTPAGRYDFNYGAPNQVQAYLALHTDFINDGADFFWVDWCCDDTRSTKPGITPDSWQNRLYAKTLTPQGQRQYVLSRIGGSHQNSTAVTPQGAWAEHKFSIHFTGDTDPALDLETGATTWPLLTFIVRFSLAEANIGIPFISHDIGSFKGGKPKLPDDYYVRWFQAGVFQPVMRIHSAGNYGGGYRLPWEYTGVAQEQGINMMRLREALVPYTYTAAHNATVSGEPIVRNLYLDYPNNPEAFNNKTEYLFGPEILVAPITSPGATATRNVWFPAGEWIDYFTGQVIQGSSTQSITKDLTQMPVYLKAGSILPLYQSQNGGNISKLIQTPLQLNIYPGDDGSFTLYDDAGNGQGYSSGESSSTEISYVDAAKTVSIGATSGTFSGQKSLQSYLFKLINASCPTKLTWQGKVLPQSTVVPTSSSGWSCDATDHAVWALVLNVGKSGGTLAVQ